MLFTLIRDLPLNYFYSRMRDGAKGAHSLVGFVTIFDLVKVLILDKVDSYGLIAANFSRLFSLYIM